MEQNLCPDCSSDEIMKNGIVIKSHYRKAQRYLCRGCGRTFSKEIAGVRTE